MRVNRRWWYGPYRAGRSCHGAPVRKTHNMPFNTCRISPRSAPVVGSASLSKPHQGPDLFPLHIGEIRHTLDLLQPRSQIKLLFISYVYEIACENFAL